MVIFSLNSKLIAKNDLIESLILFRQRPALKRLNILPFTTFYILGLSLDIYFFKTQGYYWLILPLLAFIHLFTFLFSYWFTNFGIWINFNRVNSLGQATHIKVVPLSTNKACLELIPLLRLSPSPLDHYFFYQKRKYIYTKEGVFSKNPYPIHLPIIEYIQSKGISNQDISTLHQKFGLNEFDIPIPSFWKLYLEQALAPFFIFQLICVAFWSLDDYIYYSLFTLCMLLGFEALTAKTRLTNVSIFRNMKPPIVDLKVYRDQNWTILPSNQLLPGDLCSINTNDANNLIPCDMLLLAGSCIVNEAMLTGESIPQMKEPIVRYNIHETERSLNMKSDRLNLVFSGTRILQQSPSSTTEYEVLQSIVNEKVQPLVDEPTKTVKQSPFNLIQEKCLFYVLRTGFDTTQGKLVRTILFSSENLAQNNWESFFFILILLFFAVIAATYVLIQGLSDPTKTRWKLFIECVLIITNIVPPELPMELSMAVNSALSNLSKEGIFCTESFRIPLAGKVNYCAFDKTGTLTQENLLVKGVALINDQLLESLNSLDHEKDHANNGSNLKTLSMGVDKDTYLDKEQLKKSPTIQQKSMSSGTVNDMVKEPSSFINKSQSSHLPKIGNLDGIGYQNIDDIPLETSLIMAGCHSLALLDRAIIGDPMEIATMKYINWKLSSKDLVVSSSNRYSLQIRHRFYFSSILRSMATIATLNMQDHFVLVKGAPEKIETCLTKVPDHYEYIYKMFARRGLRVIAFAIKKLPSLTLDQINNITRKEAESQLTFSGFLVFNCPLKPDSFITIKALNESSNKTVMITGDAALTACEVAKTLKIVTKPILILNPCSSLSSSTEINSTKEEMNSKPSPSLYWTSVDEKVVISYSPDTISKLSSNFDFCITGLSLSSLTESDKLKLVHHARIYSRMSPSDKGDIIYLAKKAGFFTMMCGDGTNDVSALKQAHVGLALLLNGINDPRLTTKQEKASLSNLAKTKDPRKALNEEMSRLEREQSNIVQLGDASIASPFTSRGASISPNISVIRQGRCTLVTTMQMFKILALNSLISAFALSTLQLDGVKYGDFQLTVLSMLTSICFFSISKSQPLQKLSPERPISRLFCPYMCFTVIGQFVVHLTTLIFVIYSTRQIDNSGVLTIFTGISSLTEKIPSGLESSSLFVPSLINSTVFLISATQQLTTFVVNYQGKPFMQSISDNKGLKYTLILVAAIIIISTTQISPSFNLSFQLVQFPRDFSIKLSLTLLSDFLGCWLCEYICKKFLY